MPRRKNPIGILTAAALTGSLVKSSIDKERRKSRARARVEMKGSPSSLRPRRARARPATASTALTSASSTLAVAPVSGGIVSRGSEWTFGTAQPEKGLRGVRIHGRQIWAIADSFASAGGPDTTVIQPYGGGVASHYMQTFDPDDTKTMPPPITSLSQVFSRYALRKAKVIYTPSCGTNVVTSIAMAVLTDTAFAQAADHASSSTAYQALTVAENSNSVMGPAWQTMELEVPCDGALRYTFQTVADSSLSPAEERQDHAFALYAATNTGATAPTLYGYFHIEYVLDFYEVVVSSNETSLLRVIERGKQAERRLLQMRTQSQVGRKEETPAREEKKETSSTSVEAVTPPGPLSTGWSRVPSLREWSESRATLTREGQAAGLVKSQSHKG